MCQSCRAWKLLNDAKWMVTDRCSPKSASIQPRTTLQILATIHHWQIFEEISILQCRKNLCTLVLFSICAKRGKQGIFAFARRPGSRCPRPGPARRRGAGGSWCARSAGCGASRRSRRRGGRRPWTLVERFGIEPYPDFSAKWANFTELVLFSIDAKVCK